MVRDSFEGIAISVNGKVVEANQVLADIFGYKVSELIGKTPLELVTPESAETVMRHAKTGAETVYKVTGVKKGGQTFTIEVLSKNCIYKGKPGRIAGVRDLSRRCRAERALQTGVEPFRRLADIVDEIFWLLSPDEQTLLYVNSAYERITGFSREPLYANPRAWIENVYPEDRELALALTTKESPAILKDERSAEFRLVRADGTIRWIWMRSYPVFGDEDQVSYRSVIAGDVTERKHVEEALHRAQKLESLGVLAGGVAHDFNNLLMAMMAQTSLALAKMPSDNPARAHVKKAIRAAERAAELTRQMLAYSGRGQLDIQPINLNDLIQENLHLFQVAIPVNVTLSTKLHADLPPIKGDPGQVQQVIMNLILNAAEAISDRPGHVVVATGTHQIGEDSARWHYTGEALAPGPYVTLTVQDDGAGMDEQMLAKIFDPFFTTKTTGPGLGLPAVLGIVRGHRGGLNVHSGPGKGTTFKVLFPAQQNAGADT